MKKSKCKKCQNKNKQIAKLKREIEYLRICNNGDYGYLNEERKDLCEEFDYPSNSR